VQISFDPAKSERNAVERELPFDLAAEFDFETALIGEDRRRDYGETRYVAIGRLGERLHVLSSQQRMTAFESSARARRTTGR
jgi:uncharacterized protein